ncbi:MAG: helix-turn-helix domain-containing protein [Bacteroidota bacterium]
MLVARKERELTQKGAVDFLAQRGVEMSLRTYVSYESGKSEPSFSLAIDICRAFGISVWLGIRDDGLSVLVFEQMGSGSESHPFLRGGDSEDAAGKLFNVWFEDADRLKEENESLKKEVPALRAQLELLKDLVKDIKAGPEN